MVVSPWLEFNRFRRREKFAFLRLRHDARRLDDFAELARTAVRDGRLVGVQLHDGVVNAVARERGEDVFDRVDFDIAFRERRRAVRFRDIFHARLDFRFTVEIHAAEPHAVVGGRGQNRHVDPVAAVQTDAGKTGGTIESLLVQHGQIRQNTGAIGKPNELGRPEPVEGLVTFPARER